MFLVCIQAFARQVRSHSHSASLRLPVHARRLPKPDRPRASALNQPFASGYPAQKQFEQALTQKSRISQMANPDPAGAVVVNSTLLT
jgi:hypothetical protein